MHAAESRMKGMKSFQQKRPARWKTAQALSVYHKAAASAVFQDDALHNIGHILAFVAAFFQAVEQRRPSHHVHGRAGIRVQRVHGVCVQLIALLLQAVYLNDLGVDGLGSAEIGKLLHHGLECGAAVCDDLCKSLRLGPQRADIEHIHPQCCLSRRRWCRKAP